MTKIKNYELDSTINDDDKVIGTDGLPGANFGRTKNYSIGSLVTYIENQIDPIGGSGTLNTIPMWTPDGLTLGDSIIVKDETIPSPADGIVVKGKLVIDTTGTGSLPAGPVAAFSPARIVFHKDLELNGGIMDYLDSLGTSGQILTSTGTQTSWQDFSTLVPNNITGSGTLNTVAMFTPDGTVIGNSLITQNAAGTRIDITVNATAISGNVGIVGDLDLTGVATFENDISVGEGLRDASDSYGTANQILTSTGTQTSWQDFSTLVPNNITGSGTVEYIPKFTPDGTAVGDSIMFTKPNGIELQVGVSGGTETILGAGFITTGGLGADTVTATNINAGATGTLTASGDIILGNATDDTTTVNSTLIINSIVQDSNQTVGTDGQILVANAASELIWQDQDGDTTYSVSSQQAASDVEIILAGSDVTETEVTLVAGNSISLTDDGSNNITIAATGGAANTEYDLVSTYNTNDTILTLQGSDATSDTFTLRSGSGISFRQSAGLGSTTIDFDLSSSGAVGGSGLLNHFALWSPDGQTLDSSPFRIESFGSGGNPLKATIGGNDAKFSISAVGYGDATLMFEPNVTGNNLGIFELVDPLPASPSTKFAWKKGGSEYMRLDTVTGNLGVGTTTATHKVQVEGTEGFKATDAGVSYFEVFKEFSNTAIWTGVDGGTIYIGSFAPAQSQNLQVQGTGRFMDGIKDTSNSVGTSGQILTSTGSQVQWVDLSGLIPNNVTGTGTENFGALWGAGGTVLTDSLLKHGTGVDSIGIGLNNDTQGSESIAFTRSTSKGNGSFALGYESVTDGEFSVTLGKGTYTAGRHAMATNYKSLALGQSSFAGGHTSATGGDGAVALGHNASAGNFGAAKLVATFPNDQTTFDIEGIVGTVEAGLFMRYGENLDVPDPRIEVLTFTDNGNNSATITVATGVRPIQGELVVFEEATPFRGDHQGGVALGNDAYSLGEGTVSIGHTSVAEADKAVALGDAARSSGASSVAIGKNATVTSADTIALGGDSTKILMNALAASSSYADDTAAAAGGVAIGELYRNGNIVQIRLT